MSCIVWSWFWLRFYWSFWFEICGIFFGNNTTWNVMNWSYFNNLDFSINCWLNMFIILNLSFICFLYWYPCLFLNYNWLICLVICWNILFSINCNNWFRLNWTLSNFRFKNLSIIFRDNIFRNITYISYLKCIYFTCDISWSFYQFRCFFFIDFVDWNICSSIKFNRFNSFICNWNIIIILNSNNMSWFIWNWWYFGNWLENWSIWFRNRNNWNISMVSNFKCVYMSINSWLDMFSSFNLSIISFFNWNKSFSINYNWFNTLICRWNKVFSIDWNDWFSMNNSSRLRSENLSKIFMNNVLGNICNTSNLESVTLSSFINWNFFQSICYFLWYFIDWYISDSIESNWFDCLICYWNVIIIFNSDYMGRLIWSWLSIWFFNISECCRLLFRNNIYWNICNILNFQSINRSFFCWLYCHNFTDLFFCSWSDWYINFTSNNNFLWCCIMWNVMLSIYLNNWWWYNFNWNVISCSNNNDWCSFNCC